MGDLVIESSDKFSDYRDQFVTDEEFRKTAPEYCQQAGLPTHGKQFIDHLRGWLSETSQKVDAAFPENEFLSIYELRDAQQYLVWAFAVRDMAASFED